MSGKGQGADRRARVVYYESPADPVPELASSWLRIDPALEWEAVDARTVKGHFTQCRPYNRGDAVFQ